MKMSDLEPGSKRHSAMNRRVMLVLSRRPEGWCIYMDAVPGKNHDHEWEAVAKQGSKVDEPIARLMARRYFGIDADIPFSK